MYYSRVELINNVLSRFHLRALLIKQCRNRSVIVIAGFITEASFYWFRKFEYLERTYDFRTYNLKYFSIEVVFYHMVIAVNELL